ncbi:MAG: hypothetical protein U9P42_02755, partial [Candidatus Fermentibacteria bacterium]|nr:hypothetical protein [Candidatus Fermentibacteria bacterium]
ISLVIGIIGIIVQGYGTISDIPFLQLAGLAVLIVAFYYYAKAKGRHPAFCLFGLLSIIGLLVLASLKDKSGSEEVSPGKRNSKAFLIFIALLLALIFAIPFVNSLLNH